MIKGRNTVIAKNKKARYEYFLDETFTAGIVLTGTEVKSLRLGKISLQEAYCIIEQDEVFITGMNIPEYDKGNIFNHEPVRKRKLLLTKTGNQKTSQRHRSKRLYHRSCQGFFSMKGIWPRLSLHWEKERRFMTSGESVKQRESKRELDRHLK